MSDEQKVKASISFGFVEDCILVIAAVCIIGFCSKGCDLIDRVQKKHFPDEQPSKQSTISERSGG